MLLQFYGIAKLTKCQKPRRRDIEAHAEIWWCKAFIEEQTDACGSRPSLVLQEKSHQIFRHHSHKQYNKGIPATELYGLMNKHPETGKSPNTVNGVLNTVKCGV